MNKIDEARLKVMNDEQYQLVGVEYYGRSFKHMYRAARMNDAVYTCNVIINETETNRINKIIPNHKFLDGIKDLPYYTFADNGWIHVLIFYPNCLVHANISQTGMDIPNYIHEFTVFADKEEDFDDFSKLLGSLDVIESKPKDITYRYILTGKRGFEAKHLTLESNYNINLEENFNDDLPIEEFEKFVKKDTCGLALIHGAAGCGKTSYIKNLINKYGDDRDFYILDASLLGAVTDADFINFLMEVEDSVFILEDCEKLLMSRSRTDNPWIATLLNMTDGILGESMKIKFICTFNCDIAQIDKALLREGRLDILYEFKPLVQEKAQVLCDRLDKECKGAMTLAQIYKSKLDNSSITKERKRIGF